MVTPALTVDVPPALWLSSNRPLRIHAQKARIVRALHVLGHAAAVQAGLTRLPGPLVACWTIQYPKGVRTDKGDAANAHPTCKALLDALVPTWLDDDGPRIIPEERYRRGPNLAVPHIHRVTLNLVEET